MTDELKGFILEEISVFNNVINQRKEYFEKTRMQLYSIPKEDDEKLRTNKVMDITNKLSYTEGEIMAYDNIIKALNNILNQDNPIKDMSKLAKIIPFVRRNKDD